MAHVPLRYLVQTARPIAEDLAGTLTFYLLFLVTGSARLGAAIGLALGVIQLGAHAWGRRQPPALLLIGVALTALLGGVTMVTDDPRFLLLKPSIIYAAVGASMLPRGWVRRYVPPIALDLLPARTLDRVGWNWAALMFATALFNVALVAALPPLVAGGVLVFVGTATKLLLFGSQYAILSRRARRAYDD